ncbi:hypothetical protein [Thalassolituus alkanivorans]|jgi:hypothetical protein|nr:hypothetical protein [Thalassolituus alkanivorans]|tara:strand:+ start:38 stop:166 length:129 start_codon:yes stop_codon:yes gene_type:complete
MPTGFTASQGLMFPAVIWRLTALLSDQAKDCDITAGAPPNPE